MEPLVGYTKSIIMTGDDYIKAIEEKFARKELIEKEKELRKREVEVSKGRKAKEKIQKEATKLQRLVDARARRAFAEKWSAKGVACASKELHQLIKSDALPLPRAHVGKFLTFCPEICHNNQAIVKERMRARREGRTLISPSPLSLHLGFMFASPQTPTWHTCSPTWVLNDLKNLQLELGV